MDKSYIEQKVKEFKKWYQKMDLDGVITNPTFEGGGDFVWEKIKTFLPESLEGKRILDVGCSSGYYSVQSSLIGAKEVIGIEILKRDYGEALFVKEFFEEKYNRKLNVNFINKDISDVDLKSLGKFDYVFAIAVLYHLGKHRYGQFTPEAFQEQERLIQIFSELTNNVIARTTKRPNRTTEFFTPIFEKYGFKLYKTIPEGIRTLVHYKK